MLWPREEFHAAYGQIRHDGIQSGGSSVLILVALDVDALCASAIVTDLLKSDLLSYTLLPVRGYEDVIRIRDARIRDAEGNPRSSALRSVVMINCGAIVNVTQLLALPASVKCYILDSHRPIHLANIYDAAQQIVVFDDGAQALEEFPEDGSDIDNDELLEEDSEEEEEEEGEENEDEDEDADDRGQEEMEDESEGEAEVDFGVVPSGAEPTQEEMGSPSSSSDIRKRKRSGSADDMEEVLTTDPARQSDGRGSGGEDVEMQASDGEAEEQQDPDDLDETQTQAQAQAHGAAPATAHALRRARRDIILQYYRGSFMGAPAATIAFELAQQLNAARRDLLWFAIVGLTKQLMLEEIDSDNYTLMIHRFQDEVLALDSSATGGGGSISSNGGDGAATLDPATGTVVNPAYEHGRISFEEEYRFMCYRHWSLYEAMYYSDYVAAKLGLYMDQARRFGARMASTGQGNGHGGNGDGETTLHVFLARMGFSLRQSQQKFTYMPLEMKARLRDKIMEMAPEFGLEDVFYGSFKRQFAFQYQLSAADAVHGLQALLEAPSEYITNVFQAEQHHSSQQNAQRAAILSSMQQQALSNESDASGEGTGEDSLMDIRHHNFALAHTALSCRSVASSSLMESGIKVAMELKQAIVRVGLSIMERKLIVRVKHFRYICLHIPEREQELFAHANVLTQLALFLLNVYRASGKWGGPKNKSKSKSVKKKKDGDQGDDDDEVEEEEEEEAAAAALQPIVPLVLITRNPQQNCFLVVGITCPNTPGEVHRNTLGTAFRMAAGETGANFRQDGFTSAVLEIQMDDIHYFVEQLHNVMDA